MCICKDCVNRLLCTYQRKETTQNCDEFAHLEPKPEAIDWNLSVMLADWGFTKASETSQ